MLEERHHNVANGLRDIATLIGEMRDDPVVLVSGEKVVPGLGLIRPAEQLLERVTRIEKGCLRLAVVGAVSRGKSTLVNALLGESRLSVDMEACTGVITQVVHGTNTNEVTVVEGGKSRSLAWEDFLNTVRLTPEEQGTIRNKQAFAMPERLVKIDYAVVECEYPLGEKSLHIVDTLGFRAGHKAEEITKDFLADTDALLFITRAQPLFEEADKEFLNTQLRLNESRLEHIFFVVNDFSRLDEEERLQVMQNAQTRLEDYFLTPEGDFDEVLFARRVFIVDARAALRAQVKAKKDDNGDVGDALEATGLSALERGIQQMLDDEQILTMVLEAATVQVVIPALNEASRSIDDGRELLSRNLSELERTHQKIEGQLEEINGRARHIRDTFNAFAQRIGERAADHFENYAIHMIDAWNDDWETLNVGEVMRIWNVAAATVSAARKEQLTREVGGRIGHYLERRMEQWEEEVLEHLESDMEEMATALEEEIQDFVVRLDEIQASIVGHQMLELLDMQERRASKTIQMLWGVLAFDPNQVTGSLMGGSWKGFLGRFVSQIVAVNIAIVASSFFTGPPGWIALFAVLLVEGVFMHGWARRSMLNKVRDRIGSELRTKLVDAAPDIKSEIQQSIGSQFETHSDNLLGTLQAEIDQVTAQLDNALANRKVGEAAIDTEKSRLDVIEANLNRGFEQVSHEVYGRTLTPEEHERLRQGNALLSENA
jgi:GTPase SAR1 family protein